MFSTRRLVNPKNNIFNNLILGLLCGKKLFLEMNKVSTEESKKPILYIMMSLDCDVVKDTYSLKKINEIFSARNIKVSIAATAKLAEENTDLYDNFLSNGHELVNHGYSLHSGIDEAGKTYSTFFYNKVDWNFIKREIVTAQEVFYKLFSLEVKGFRAPHFGVFQGKDEILKLYDILHNYNFKYSSSVMAYNMFKNNWNFFSNKVVEVPVTNRVALPYSVIDSYSLVYNQGFFKYKNKFYREFKQAVNLALSSKYDMFINVYFDPSQMIDNDNLELTLDYIFNNVPSDQLKFMTYTQFINRIKD